MTNFTTNSPPREAFLASEAEELPLALVYVVRDPETGEERELVIPLSLIAKLWPELTETIAALEEKLREYDRNL